MFASSNPLSNSRARALYEETLDCSLGPEFEAKNRNLAKQKSKESDAEENMIPSL